MSVLCDAKPSHTHTHRYRHTHTLHITHCQHFYILLTQHYHHHTNTPCATSTYLSSCSGDFSSKKGIFFKFIPMWYIPSLNRSPTHFATCVQNGRNLTHTSANRMEHLARAYHKCDHDGQSVGYLLGSLYQDDSQTDGHPHHTSQEGR